MRYLMVKLARFLLKMSLNGFDKRRTKYKMIEHTISDLNFVVFNRGE